LPASLGLHPAFRWPLVPGRSKTTHRLVFEREEPGPLRRLDARGLLTPELHPTPIRGRELGLREDLFREDALIFLEPRSRSLRFEAEDGPSMTLRWEGFPQLGVWTKPDPGPAFVCVEPWAGYASPADWEGEFSEKPGTFLLAPGAMRQWTLSIALTAGS
jgi:galactose mutarotase-like enzyme